ncbi:hypothetical protein B0T18DRAFT_433604 [Schizothecium vesticola]|uniref:Uncharacterized protein n=1 Tax=Schizothecium vesticola TaxID=314040 RepID=A0AA40EIM1_9PEZI|nr:hypothetical protein B0T18DRAFT_433604 [Schizothecium vesticola]
MTFDDQSSQTFQTRFATRQTPPTPTNAHQSTTPPPPTNTDKLDSHTGSRFGLRSSSSRTSNPNPMDLFGPGSDPGYSHHPAVPQPQQTAYPPLTDTSYGSTSTHPQPSTSNPPTSSSSLGTPGPAPAPSGGTTLQVMRTNARKSFAEQVRSFSHLDDVSTDLSEMPKIQFKNRLFVLERWLNRPRARTSSIAEHGEFLMEVRARDNGAYAPVESVWACTVGECNHDLFSAKASSAALMHLEKRHGIVKTLAEERARNAALRQELDDQRRRYEEELRVQRERHVEEMRMERERFSKNEDRLWRMIEKANED